MGSYGCHRLIVLRNGILIGATAVQIEGVVAETTAYSLANVDAQGFHWLQLPLPGQSWSGNREMTASEHSRMTMPEQFRTALDGILSPGVTLIVTADSLLDSSTGKTVLVLDSKP